MNEIGGSGRGRGGGSERLPRFELDYLVDDMDDPSEVMIVPNWDDDSGLERWIKTGIEHAVPLDEIA
jgi:heme-degrading monooxygenase HmoA